MSDDDCDEVINAAQQQALLPSRQAQGEALKSESLSLGLVDAIHHTVQVQCRLPESLASSNVSGCQCYFGDQVVPGTLDPSGALVCYAPPPKPCRGRYAQEKSCQLNVVVSGQIVASSTFQYTAVPFWRKPSLEGRFSGRLPTKEDERRLAEECRLVAPLLGGTCAGRGERSMSSLAKLARAIAGGRVRQHCEEREHKIQLLQQHIARLEAALSGSGSIQGLLPSSAGSVAALSAANATLQDELSHMRNQMSAKDDELAELKRQLRLKEQLWADMAKGSCCASAITPCNGTSAQCPPGSSCPTPASSADAAAATGAAAGGGKGSQRGGSAGGPRSKRQRQQQQQAAQPSHTAQQQQQQQQQQQMLLQQLCCGGAPCGPGAAPAAHASGEGGCSSWARVTNAQPAASLPLFDSLLASLPGLKELGNMRVPMSLPGLASSMPPASGPQAQLHQMQQLHTRSLQPPQLFPFAGQVPNLQAPAQAAPLGTTCASPGAAASAPASAAPSAAGKLGLPAHVVASAGVAAPCAANPSSCATACTPAPAPSGSCCSTGQAAPHHLQQQQQQQQQMGLSIPEVPRGPTPETGDSALDPNACCFGLIDCSGDDLQQLERCPPEQPRQQVAQQQRQQQLLSPSMPLTQPMQPPPNSMLNPPQPLSRAQSVALPTPLSQQPMSGHAVPLSVLPQGAGGDPGLMHTLVSSLANAQKQLEQLQEMQAQQARAHQEQQSQLVLLHRRLGSQQTSPALVQAGGMPASQQQPAQPQLQPTRAVQGGVGAMAWPAEDEQMGVGNGGEGDPDDFSKLWMN